MRFFVVCLFVLVVPQVVHAMGNHPESSSCTSQKPYYPICTHALHNLEGWFGECYATREQAQQAADKHVADYHHGNSRWTGVKKAK